MFAFRQIVLTDNCVRKNGQAKVNTAKNSTYANRKKSHPVPMKKKQNKNNLVKSIKIKVTNDYDKSIKAAQEVWKRYYQKQLYRCISEVFD